MLHHLVLAFEQLGDRRIRNVILWTLLITLAISAALIAAASGVLAALEISGVGFVDWAIAVLGGLAAAFVAWMLFPVIAAEMVYVFVDQVADAVESRHYPKLPKARSASFLAYMGAGIRLGILMGVFNLLILPLSFIPFAQIIYPFLYYTINGALLGREFFEVVAPRRMSFAETRRLRRKYRFKVFVSGVVIALLFTIPVFNLIAPVVATSFMVHVFHSLDTEGARAGALVSNT